MSEALRAAFLQDRAAIAVTGEDRVKFLQGMVTNDMRRLTPGKALYAGFLTGQGKLVCDALLVGDADRILIDVAATHVQALLARLSAFKLRAAVEFAEAVPALRIAVLWGAEAPFRLGLGCLEGTVAKVPLTGAYAFVDPRLGALGVRVIYLESRPIEAAISALGFEFVGSEGYAAHRIALGIADTGELGGEICYPLEANFELLHGVDFKKGCYVGQELTARMKLKGELRKRILPVTGGGPLPEAGTAVSANGTELGSLIAASGSQGLALLRLDRLAGAKDIALCAQDVSLRVHWPGWLSH